MISTGRGGNLYSWNIGRIFENEACHTMAQNLVCYIEVACALVYSLCFCTAVDKMSSNPQIFEYSISVFWIEWGLYHDVPGVHVIRCSCSLSRCYSSRTHILALIQLVCACVCICVCLHAVLCGTQLYFNTMLLLVFSVCIFPTCRLRTSWRVILASFYGSRCSNVLP